jgi:hypothetical protein
VPSTALEPLLDVEPEPLAAAGEKVEQRLPRHEQDGGHAGPEQRHHGKA